MGARLRQDLEAGGNRAVRHLGALYDEHRARLTGEILTLGPAPGGELALLGAGNCHDVDLPALARQFARIHLVDIDAAALARAIAQQPADVRARLVPHAPVDLTGLAPSSATTDAAVTATAQAILARLPTGLAAVASCCVLTQLAWGLEQAQRPRGPITVDGARALTSIHLRVMAGLLAPGGGALLATDLVCSDTYPIDELPPDTDLGALVLQLLSAGNHFAVADPRIASRLLRRDPALAASCTPAVATLPWRWTGPQDRTYLVHALRFTRRG